MKTIQETLGLCMQTRVCIRMFNVCVHIHELAYAARVPEVMKDKFFALKIEVWNESHIVWEPF